jgi:ABC-type antimicrobial peptide transport system permease subunit
MFFGLYDSNDTEFKSKNTVIYVAENQSQDFQNLSLNPNHFDFWATEERVVYDGDYLFDLLFKCVDENYPQLYADFFLDGKTETIGKNDCIIGTYVAEKYNVKLHNQLTVGSKTYEVTGITNLKKFSKHILLSDDSTLEVGYPKNYYFENSVTGLNSLSGKVFDKENMNDYISSTHGTGNDIFVAVLICTFILFYTFLGLVNIINFYKLKTKVSREVQLTIGANRFGIFFQMLIENFFLTALSVLSGYFILVLSANIVNKNTSFYMSAPTELLYMLFLIGAIVSIISSIICISDKNANKSGISNKRHNRQAQKGAL